MQSNMRRENNYCWRTSSAFFRTSPGIKLICRNHRAR